MPYLKTTATNKILKLDKRLRCIQGGTAASKTVSIVLYLIAMAQNDKSPTMTSIVSESLPHLKRGAMRDFLLIMEQHNYYKEERFNKSDLVYTFETGSKIEFFSVDQPEKVRGPRRQRLFINEANNIPFETFEQLEIRTEQFIFLDWNPTNEFWFYTEVLGKRNDIDHIILTYKDNEALGQSIVDSIETRKARKGWWQVYGMGLLGEVEGKIYRDWAIIEEIPHEARLERYGIDFGYSSDPTSIIAVYRFNNALILDEVLYQREISNREIANTLRNLPRAMVVADSAEPKSIEEIHGFGINILPCAKGRDSVQYGIKLVQDQRISMTKRSVNLIKDYRNYLWEIDKNGLITTIPEHRYSHTMDCLAKGTMIKTQNGDKPIEEIKKGDYVFTREGLNKVKDSWLVKTNAKVIQLILSNGKTLTGTSNHRIWTQEGWKLLTQIRYGDTLEEWRGFRNTTEENILSIPKKENFTSITARTFYTGKCGRIILERFRKIVMFITKTALRLTTGFQILNSWIKDCMDKFTLNNVSLRTNNAILADTPLKPALSGLWTDFVQTNAKVNGGETRNLILSGENVKGAERNSSSTNINSILTVPVTVAEKRELENKFEVYDITVEKCNEYFANDILVHNSVRYAISTISKLYRTDTPKEIEDRMFKEMIKKRQMGRARERLFIH